MNTVRVPYRAAVWIPYQHQHQHQQAPNQYQYQYYYKCSVVSRLYPECAVIVIPVVFVFISTL